MTRVESAAVGHEPRLRGLRAANEQLVMAALTAQELEAHAEEAHRRQIKFLAMVAHELRNPLTLGSEFVVTLPVADRQTAP